MKLVLAAKSFLLKGINITMKCLLLTLIAAFALPTAVNAESYWLILSSGAGGSSALEKIEMASMEQCKEKGEIFASERIKFKMNKKQYECLKGK